MMNEDFRAEIDAALPRVGYSDRSAFIRQAVYKSLQELGIEIPAHLMAAPSRKNKGGRPSHKAKVIMRDNHGMVNLVQKKKSISTYAAPGRTGVEDEWRLNEKPVKKGKK